MSAPFLRTSPPQKAAPRMALRALRSLPIVGEIPGILLVGATNFGLAYAFDAFSAHRMSDRLRERFPLLAGLRDDLLEQEAHSGLATALCELADSEEGVAAVQRVWRAWNDAREELDALYAAPPAAAAAYDMNVLMRHRTYITRCVHEVLSAAGMIFVAPRNEDEETLLQGAPVPVDARLRDALLASMDYWNVECANAERACARGASEMGRAAYASHRAALGGGGASAEDNDLKRLAASFVGSCEPRASDREALAAYIAGRWRENV